MKLSSGSEGVFMAKRNVQAAEKKPMAETSEVVSQLFKVDQPTYLKVRTLAAIRRGTGRAATGQDIYLEAVREYLERHAVELEVA